MAARPKSRAKFLADLATAQEDGCIPNVSDVTPGDHGEFVFAYNHARLPSQLEIQVVTQEASSYPAEHLFLAFAQTDASAALSRVLEDFAPASVGLKIPDALGRLSRDLGAALGDNDNTAQDIDQDHGMTDADDEEGSQEGSEDEYFEDFDYDEDDTDAIFGLAAPGTAAGPALKDIDPETRARIRRDYRAVRDAGFKVARVCGLEEMAEYHIMSIAVHAGKLCLSTETREAWGLGAEDFVVLLVRYDWEYTTYEQALDRAAGRNNLQFRLRKCSRYKPSVEEAVSAFSAHGDGPGSLGLLAVGVTIDTFMGSDFLPMLKLRAARGCSWDAAKNVLAGILVATVPQESERPAQQPAPSAGQSASSAKSDDAEDCLKLPSFLANDHLRGSSANKSLPLIAAQFAFRYLVRCTDYCMVCHQRVEGNFEALKPYVCSKALCLFQYMSMGCGPSIDHEIVNQPNVVDLLVSFCYTSLKGNGSYGIREFPTGLSLQLPNIQHDDFQLPNTQPNNDPQLLSSASFPEPSNDPNIARMSKLILVDSISVVFDWDASTIDVVVEDADRFNLKWKDRWVAIITPSKDGHNNTELPHTVHHAQIMSIMGRTASLRVASWHTLSAGRSIPIECPDEAYMKARVESAHGGLIPARVVMYCQNLDDIKDERQKVFHLGLLLATIPPVHDMRMYLKHAAGRRIENWERLTPSAFKLLRWIVSSNRSYIVQVDHSGSEEEEDRKLGREDERISGVEGWMQFRFAQGSPEKEMLFQKELKHVTKPQRTLVAWHGSRLENWHSIIREGLDYKVTLNGRAHGHGVYFSKDFDYSAQYANSVGLTFYDYWHNSGLKISGAMSLNELINRPDEYVHSKACFVVQHTHWIQCRYLLVKSTAGGERAAVPFAPVPPAPNGTGLEYQQDPLHTATGPGRKKILIPKIAFSSTSDTKKPRAVRESAPGHTGDSDDEDADDVAFLDSDDGGDHDERRPSTPSTGPSDLRTDFRPGTLDLDSLPKLNPPSYATSHGQRTIGKEMTRMQKIQGETPLHQLGWYVDFDKITNMYHWIVELHSFDATLLLAQDMKKAQVSSVVLEVRFGRDFPLSPPFVRVIRPRFLPFLNGGGGHVTAGGAMCMELLTNNGWSPANSLESVILQVRMAITSTEPRPARLQRSLTMDYGIGEAVQAFQRSAATHQWRVPDDMTEMTSQPEDALP